MRPIRASHCFGTTVACVVAILRTAIGTTIRSSSMRAAPPPRCDWSKPRRASKVVLKKSRCLTHRLFFFAMSMKPYWILALSLLGIAFAGPLVRLSAADPVAIAVWRIGFSLLIVAACLLATGEWRDWAVLNPRELGLAGVGGVSLALHFWAWNASIHLTTIAASVTLVNLQPAVVATISAIALREVPTTKQVVGIAIAILGAMVVAAPDLRGGLAPSAVATSWRGGGRSCHGFG